MANPILPTLPATTLAVQRKYADPTITGLLGQVPAPIANALQELDQQRANQGKNPLSSKQTVAALSTALNGKPYTPAALPGHGIFDLFGNAVTDLRSLVTSVPRLLIPNRGNPLYKEITELPHIPEYISEALQTPGGYGKQIQALTRVPGIRFIPGAYTLGNVAAGDIDEIAQHPLFTGLDVLPYAKSPALAPVRGAIAASPAGTVAKLGRDAFFASRLGNVLTEATGVGAKAGMYGQVTDELGRSPVAIREAARLQNNINRRVEDLGTVNGPETLDSVALQVREDKQLAQQFPNITPERRVELTTIGEETPELINSLPEHEQAYLQRLRDSANKYAQWAETPFVEGEFYDVSMGNQLLNLDIRREKWVNNKLPTIIERLTPYAAKDKRVALALQHLEDGNYIEAGKVASAWNRRNVLDRDLRTSIRDIRLGAYYDKRYNTLLQRHAPARFKPLIAGKVRDELLDRYSLHPDFDKLGNYIAHGLYSTVEPLAPGLTAEANLLVREFERSWQDLKASGVDPIFVHRVAPGSEPLVDNPRILQQVPQTVSAQRKRTFDFSPSTKDAAIALPAQGIELLIKKGTEEFAEEFKKAFGFTQQEVLPLYMRAYGGEYDAAMRAFRRDFKEWEPTRLLPWKNANVSGLSTQEQIFVAKPMSKMIDQMMSPPLQGFSKAVDPIMRVFRTSVLALSPRWQIYNAFGGGMMVAAEDPAILKNLFRARQMVKNEGLPVELVGGTRFLHRDIKLWNAEQKAAALYNFKAGQQLRNIYDAAKNSRLAKAVGQVPSYSYELNAVVDDMYRGAAYLTGKDKALVKGLSKAEAHEAGVNLARKVFQRLDEMTPIERSVIRSVFPFYGWVSHIMKYTMQYPFDHPIRTAIVGSFTRNELADYGTSLPQKFLSSFFLGHPDSHGNVKAINFGSMNPFRNVSDYFTWAGITQSINPIISTILESMGVDPSKGAADLYPNVRFDPETGRLSTAGPGFLHTIVGNVIPQVELLTALTGANEEFKQLLRTNPEAASRLLASQAGLPVIFRHINVPQEQFKEELARQDAQAQAKSRLLHQGNVSGLARYPGLAPLLEQIRQLEASKAINQYRPPASPSPYSAIGGAVKSFFPVP